MDVNWRSNSSNQGDKVKRKYVFLMIFVIVLIIIMSIVIVPIVSVNIFSDAQETSHRTRPNVIIIADNSYGTAPLKVSFKSLTENFEQKLTYAWDFGDGTISNEEHPHHIYAIDGNYTCTLTITDEISESSDNVTITALENYPPIIKIVVDKASGNRPLTVTFDVDGFDFDGEIASYNWEIIYPPFFSKQKTTTHDEKNFSERFIQSGFYEIKLTVKDDFGNTATDYIKIQVLKHKLELFAFQSYFIYQIIKSFYNNIYLKIIDKISANTPQTFVERILSSWR